MTHIHRYIVPFFFCLLLVLILIPISKKIALKLQLVDQPNHRKIHKEPIPIIGGIVILISSFITLTFYLNHSHEILKIKNLVLGCFILTLLGVLDDKYDIKSHYKLFVQFFLAHIVFMEGIRIESLYGFLGIYSIPILYQYLLTTAIITGAINAFNLMDGIDGLASGLAILAFIVFSTMSIVLGQFSFTIIFITFIGGLIGFLRFNLSKNQKVFMGDAGSLTLGFIIITSAIVLLNASSHYNFSHVLIPIIMGVVFFPIIDSLRVYRGRLKDGKSPFKADKTHFHHLMLYISPNHLKASILIILFSASLIFFGYWTYSIFGITFSLICLSIYYGLICCLFNTFREMNHWLENIKRLEN